MFSGDGEVYDMRIDTHEMNCCERTRLFVGNIAAIPRLS